MKAAGRQNKGTNRSSKRGGLGRNSSESMKVTSQRKKTLGKSKLGITAQLPQLQPSPSEIEQANVKSMISEEPKNISKITEQCSKKLKLQLFPINEYTKKVLEEDKFNPYLELTLTTRKKISSVVKHLNVKWGSSREALGDLVLFPFDNASLDNAANARRWTLQDSDITAADVHASLGNPDIFRLWYGWSNHSETVACMPPVAAKTNEPECSLKPNLSRFGAESKQPFSISSKEKELVLFDRTFGNAAAANCISDKLVQNEDNPTTHKDVKFSWVDGISNMSFGALLSEASHGPNPNPSQPVHAQRFNFQQMTSATSDSFDAAIAALVARNEPPSLTLEMPVSSIWEAEQACHAFPSKTASSQKNLVSSDEGPSLWKISSTTVLKNKVATEEQALANNDDVMEETKEGLLSQASNLQHNSNQFSAVDINLPESLGSFDNASCSRGMTGVETVGLAGLISSSMDAFQNFSIF